MDEFIKFENDPYICAKLVPGVLFTMADYDIKEVRRVVRMMEGLE